MKTDSLSILLNEFLLYFYYESILFYVKCILLPPLKARFSQHMSLKAYNETVQ